MAQAQAAAQAQVTVAVQTLAGNGGNEASLTTVRAAVAAYNKANKAAHVVVSVPVLPNNTKGMQWQLALLATLARANGATMVRLSVHGGAVALCGTASAIEATRKAQALAHNALVTSVANAYNPATHGNRVGFTNAYLCGVPAGIAAGSKVVTALAYGIGTLYTFDAPTNASAYALGVSAGKAIGNFGATPRTPRATKPGKGTATSASTGATETATETATA